MNIVLRKLGMYQKKAFSATSDIIFLCQNNIECLYEDFNIFSRHLRSKGVPTLYPGVRVHVRIHVRVDFHICFMLKRKSFSYSLSSVVFDDILFE